MTIIDQSGTTRRAPGRRRQAPSGPARRAAAGIVAAACALALLAGCAPSPAPDHDGRDLPTSDERGVVQHGPEPTARSYVDDVETWDLTVPPSVEAFGIDPDADPTGGVVVGAYSSTRSRHVRFLLPGGDVVDLQAVEVVFESRDRDEPFLLDTTGEVLVGEGRQFSLWSDARTRDGAAAGVEDYRRVLGQMGLPDDSVAELEDAIASLGTRDPVAWPSYVGAGDGRPVGDGMSVGVDARVSDPDPESVALRFTAVWEPVPIPVP